MSEALFTAIRGRDAGAVSSLARGAALEAFDEDETRVLGATPLMVALLEQAWDLADLLVARGASLEGRSEEGLPPLLALQSTPVAAAATKWLLAKGARVNGRGGSDGTSLCALHAACEGGNAEAAELLLAAGADATQKDDAGRTPLHVAAAEHEVPIVRALLARGSLHAGLDDGGATPLHLAAASTDDLPLVAEVVRLLKEAGASLEVKDGAGQTPWDCARLAKQPHEVVALLRPASARVPWSESFVPVVLTVVFGFMASAGLFVLLGGLGVDLSRVPLTHPTFPGFVFALLVSLLAALSVPLATKGLANGAEAPRLRWLQLVLGLSAVLVVAAVVLGGPISAAGVVAVMPVSWLIGRAGLPAETR